jgi:hypothetical protein
LIFGWSIHSTSSRRACRRPVKYEPVRNRDGRTPRPRGRKWSRN